MSYARDIIELRNQRSASDEKRAARTSDRIPVSPEER